MSKNLLNEAQIRKFMKLANIPALANDFVDKNKIEEEQVQVQEEVVSEPEAEVEVVQEETEAEAQEELDESKVEAEKVEEEEVPTEEVVEEEELPMDEPADEGAEGAVEDMLKKFIEAGAEAVGLDVSVEDDEGAEEELPMDEPMEEEPPMEEPEGEADRYGMMEKNEISEELAAAIAQRVYDRILQETKKQEVAEDLDIDKLAQRVAKRLVKDSEK
mgnify:FL=1|tara:strand:+ start:1889 stop:2539 length:651 start_codon:yes stop_codon:yes gene_type:complete